MRDRLHDAKVTASQVRVRLDSFNIGPLRISIGKDDTEAAIARQVMAELEGRRVLFNPPQMEAEEQCAYSVLTLKDKLSEWLGQVEQGSPLWNLLRQMRTESLVFLDETNHPRHSPYGFDAFGPQGDARFWMALGELRRTFGLCIAEIADLYGLDVDAGLAAILIREPSDQD